MAFRLHFLKQRAFWLRFSLLVLIGGPIVAGANLWVIRRARDYIVTDLAKLPKNDVGLVLGTSRYDRDGSIGNPFFFGRINAAARLYHDGKVHHFLVSGDNSRKDYDEPTWMRDALVERGVPISAITLDYAGFRTRDSMARAKVVFGLQRFTIITDDFHMARSVFLARSYGLDVVGFPSTPVRQWLSKRIHMRELASRTVACLEVYLLHTQPRFYGPPVKIDLAAAPM